jgi:membrane protease YdiL (CAAX protease family)
MAWILLAATFGTAALLRQFHDLTPVAPAVSPVVGSALFAAIFLLLLVTARERRGAGTGGPGVRLGTITPIMLFLLVEKWASLALYPLLMGWLVPDVLDRSMADALFRTLAGLGLVTICLAVGGLSVPTMRKAWRRARPARWPVAAAGVVVVVGGSYLLLGLMAALLGGGLRFELPRAQPLLFWVLGGQSVLAFAEELYYRGLLLNEMERVTPRLGVRSPVSRRWIALSSTALLFGLEHLTLGPPWDQSLRELVFVISLGLLLGILVMVSTNLHFAAGVHAWINWLLLGAAPHFVDASGRTALPAGGYIGLALMLAFVLTYAYRRLRSRRVYRAALLES